MSANYKKIKSQIEQFCSHRLENEKEAVLERFEELSKKNKSMVQNAQKPELISAAIVYSYLREHGLNGRGGITAKELAQYFNATSNAITQKVFDVDCIVNRNAIFPDEPYEFIDVDRFDVADDYYNFLESPEADDFKKSEKILLSFIKKDPDFFDTYTVLHEYYMEDDKTKKAFELMAKGYERAMKLILEKGKFPDVLCWGFMENRHIIRLLFNFACLLWATGKKEEALQIFTDLLKSNPNDNIGARYAIAGLLDGFNSFLELEAKFDKGDGFLDWEKQGKWFEKCVKKHQVLQTLCENIED